MKNLRRILKLNLKNEQNFESLIWDLITKIFNSKFLQFVISNDLQLHAIY